MMTKKYAVAWHEDNDSGAPKYVMGMSPLFDTEEQAKRWLAQTVDEDRERAAENEEDIEVEDGTNGDGVFETFGNGQHCLYKIEEIEVYDHAADCAEGMYNVLKAMKPDCAVEAMRRYEENCHRFLPEREWAVDIRFCPACCVHRVKARTKEEAVAQVERMLDEKGGDVITDAQKKEMMDSLIENVESIEVVGTEE